MAILFLVGHFVLFLALSLYFNIKRLDKELGFKIVISLLEALTTYLIVASIFFYEFIGVLWIYIIHVVMIMPGAIAVAYFAREINENWDWVLENIKNNVLIFLKFLLPFYVFMTVFQNQSIVIQLIYSIALTLVIFVLAYWIRKKVGDKVSFFILNVKNSTNALLAVWISVGLVCAYLLFFFHPQGAVAVALNLADHHSYWIFLFDPIAYQDLITGAFPLYTQFGLLIFIPILVGAIFSITNYRKDVQVIDINTAYGTEDIKGEKDL